MENKKLGLLIVLLSIGFVLFLLYFNYILSQDSISLECNPTGECMEIQKGINITNIGFGFFGFMLALGFYILFFNKTEEKILKKLEEDNSQKIGNEKFKFILMALDPFEKKVLEIVKEQEGITQNTLRIRSDMSKAKLSYVLQELEKRNLIKRVQKGKTFEIYLKIGL